ncbi:MAG: hypothetical protein K1X66_08265 [Verrucomicrobiae bacterium]|nr:hypothetical protein [Verrucomicrobiae bacterium]
MGEEQQSEQSIDIIEPDESIAEDELAENVEIENPVEPDLANSKAVDSDVSDIQNSLDQISPLMPSPMPAQPMVTLPGQNIQPLGPSPSLIELDDETKKLIELTPEERAILEREQQEAREALNASSDHDTEEPDNAEEPDTPEKTETTSLEPATTEERLGKWEVIKTENGNGKVTAMVGNDIDPKNSEALNLGNWDLNIPGMKVEARSNGQKNDMTLIWEKAALPTTSNTPPSPAKITKPECVVQETDKTSKISCVFPKPDQNLDNIKLGHNHLLVDIKNEMGGRTRMDIIWDKAASPSNQQSPAQPNVVPTVH